MHGCVTVKVFELVYLNTADHNGRAVEGMNCLRLLKH
jgi:hypothetical protein